MGNCHLPRPPRSLSGVSGGSDSNTGDTTWSNLRGEHVRHEQTPGDSFRRTTEIASSTPSWLVRRSYPASSFAFLYGPSGVGKSFVALDLALSIATGRPWHGHPVKQGPVLYVVTEGLLGFRSRLSAWEQHSEVGVAGGVHFTREAIQLVNDQHRVASRVVELQPTLIVLDTLAQVAEGLDENSSKDMGQVTAALRTIKASSSKPTVVVVHHTGHQEQGRLRGHSLLKASADWILGLRRARKPGELVLSREKARDAATGKNLALVLRPVGDSCVIITAGDSTSSLQLTTGDEPPTSQISPGAMAMLGTFQSRWTILTTAKWRKAAGTSERTFHRRRNELVKEGFVECLTKRGMWKLTDSGANIRFSSEAPPLCPALRSYVTSEPGGNENKCESRRVA